ncbi:MAG: aminotransferase class V-fold PLP-dependent enzyme, partial [Caldilinea sp.]|nr:aminotransferase class V-fold PLP-dependent enzyme [Caldilinea sp.]
MWPTDLEKALDAADPLAPLRARFHRTDPELIYLDGNSLGRLPTAGSSLAAEMVEQQWGERLIRSWNEGWFELPERVGAKIARLIGAQPEEVLVADATSVNLFKLALAALRCQPGRTRILTDDLNFPSDLYVLQGVVELLGNEHRLEILPSPDGVQAPVDLLKKQLDDDVALVVLSHVAFKSGYLYDMETVTATVQAAGAWI